MTGTNVVQVASSQSRCARLHLPSGGGGFSFGTAGLSPAHRERPGNVEGCCLIENKTRLLTLSSCTLLPSARRLMHSCLQPCPVTSQAGRVEERKSQRQLRRGPRCASTGRAPAAARNKPGRGESARWWNDSLCCLLLISRCILLNTHAQYINTSNNGCHAHCRPHSLQACYISPESGRKYKDITTNLRSVIPPVHLQLSHTVISNFVYELSGGSWGNGPMAMFQIVLQNDPMGLQAVCALAAWSCYCYPPHTHTPCPNYLYMTTPGLQQGTSASSSVDTTQFFQFPCLSFILHPLIETSV